MNICVLNGSPKANYSITLQNILYLQKRYPQHTFDILNIGAKINLYEKDMSEPLSAIEKADLLIFVYPVYTFIAPSQLHRFIRAMKESGVDFSGKYSTQITTSMHFYDVTAHRYIEDNAQDMGMKVVHGLSAGMDDLTTEDGRQTIEKFFEYVIWCIDKNICEAVSVNKAKKLPKYTKSYEIVTKKSGYDTVIVADLKDGDNSLKEMIEDFQNVYPYNTRIVNLADFKFRGGCLGCLKCAVNGKCVYKDGFDTFLREQIQSADAIVYAFNIVDHSMGTTLKTYDDRQFCNGHRTVTEGKPFAYIVRGDYPNEMNLRMVVEGRAEVGHNYLAGVGYDNMSIGDTANRLAYSLENNLLMPRNFYGVGGMKIFRDLIWIMRGIMSADHEFYKEHKLYDFPQNKTAQMIGMCALGALIRNPKVKDKMGNKMSEGMVAPYKKIVEKAKPKF